MNVLLSPGPLTSFQFEKEPVIYFIFHSIVVHLHVLAFSQTEEPQSVNCIARNRHLNASSPCTTYCTLYVHVHVWLLLWHRAVVFKCAHDLTSAQSVVVLMRLRAALRFCHSAQHDAFYAKRTVRHRINSWMANQAHLYAVYMHIHKLNNTACLDMTWSHGMAIAAWHRQDHAQDLSSPDIEHWAEAHVVVGPGLNWPWWSLKMSKNDFFSWILTSFCCACRCWHFSIFKLKSFESDGAGVDAIV